MIRALYRLLLFPLRHAGPVGVRAAARQMCLELELDGRHRAAVRKLRRATPASPLRIHIACGPNFKEGWVNLDLFRRDAFQLDIRRTWPFEDGSAQIIYSEHFFEHLEHPVETQHFLREAMRVLAPGGTLSTGVPDAEQAIRMYSSGNEEALARLREQWLPEWCETHMDAVNYSFRQGTEHRYAWDHETLEKALVSAGFVDVRRREFDPALDSELRREGTLYADARRPG